MDAFPTSLRPLAGGHSGETFLSRLGHVAQPRVGVFTDRSLVAHDVPEQLRDLPAWVDARAGRLGVVLGPELVERLRSLAVDAQDLGPPTTCSTGRARPTCSLSWSWQRVRTRTRSSCVPGRSSTPSPVSGTCRRSQSAEMVTDQGIRIGG